MAATTVVLACLLSVRADVRTAANCELDANLSISLIQTGSAIRSENRDAPRTVVKSLTNLEGGKAHDDKRATVFCHIGKTGGTSFQEIMKKLINPEKASFADGHEGAYNHLHACSQNVEEKYVFYFRAPVHRYISGWISRYRMGGTAYFDPWIPSELLAFWNFHSPDDLGRALSSEDAKRRAAAEQAMNSIFHVKWSITDYWGGLDNFNACSKSPFFVGRVEFMDEDYNALLKKMSSYGELLDSDTDSFPPLPYEHETPAKYDGWRYLSATAIENLQNWFHDDYVLATQLGNLGYLPKNYSDYIFEYDKNHGEDIDVNLWTFRTPYYLAFAACLFLLLLTCLVFVGNRMMVSSKVSYVQPACKILVGGLVLSMTVLLAIIVLVIDESV